MNTPAELFISNNDVYNLIKNNLTNADMFSLKLTSNLHYKYINKTNYLSDCNNKQCNWFANYLIFVPICKIHIFNVVPSLAEAGNFDLIMKIYNKLSKLFVYTKSRIDTIFVNDIITESLCVYAAKYNRLDVFDFIADHDNKNVIYKSLCIRTAVLENNLDCAKYLSERYSINNVQLHHNDIYMKICEEANIDILRYILTVCEFETKKILKSIISIALMNSKITDTNRKIVVNECLVSNENHMLIIEIIHNIIMNDCGYKIKVNAFTNLMNICIETNKIYEESSRFIASVDTLINCSGQPTNINTSVYMLCFVMRICHCDYEHILAYLRDKVLSPVMKNNIINIDYVGSILSHSINQLEIGMTRKKCEEYIKSLSHVV
jgi:hypothetical protein